MGRDHWETWAGIGGIALTLGAGGDLTLATQVAHPWRGTWLFGFFAVFALMAAAGVYIILALFLPLPLPPLREDEPGAQRRKGQRQEAKRQEAAEPEPRADLPPQHAPPDPVELLRAAYREGNALRETLVWPPSGPPETADQARREGERARRAVCNWAKGAWQVLDEHFVAYEREFYGPGDRSLGASLFYMSCEREMADLGGDPSAYLDKKLTFLADLLRRFDPTPAPQPVPPSAPPPVLQIGPGRGAAPQAPPEFQWQVYEDYVELTVPAGIGVDWSSAKATCTVIAPDGQRATATTGTRQVLPRRFLDLHPYRDYARAPRFASVRYPHYFEGAPALQRGWYYATWLVPINTGGVLGYMEREIKGKFFWE